jgi:(E)-4-hydroxy-3-methylbut-2-enyl-diphosphate synthase
MLALKMPYVSDLYAYRRRRTREVMVGDVGVGGDNPIRVQSMTTTLTKDVDATVAQAERLVEVGCEIVRITTPTPSDARCLGVIKERLAAMGIRVPLVADIHFSPLAAEVASEYADKVRVNPGNYADSRRFAVREYTDEEYRSELRRVEERFTPLVLKCRDRGISMRIGTNHGSLSDRIMNRWGDTPEGMVESALEFVRVCRKHEFHDIILSMKASNPKIMVAAYRLLAARMAELDMDYPFHLGVTEAGNAEDGRIKSAIGIGSLLEDGIGDTIRVSLTEEPEAEVPVAFGLANRYSFRAPAERSDISQDADWDPFHYGRRRSSEVQVGGFALGGDRDVAVFTSVDDVGDSSAMARVLRWASPAGRRQPKPEGTIFTLRGPSDVEAVARIASRLRKWPQASLTLVAGSDDPGLLFDALDHAEALILTQPAVPIAPVAAAARESGKVLILEAVVDSPEARRPAVDAVLAAATEAAALGVQVVLALRARDEECIHAHRLLAARAAELKVYAPLLLQAPASPEALLPASIFLGSLLCDGIGDAIAIGGMDDASELSFNILQAAGTRIFKTDYVACPSCGRTLFDLQETTERIKRRTTHLVGVKLAIMGCIVNGPGEMADADFGYVGGAPGQVNLYVGKECVEKGVPAEEADDRLVDLIKARGKWQEPEDL